MDERERERERESGWMRERESEREREIGFMCVLLYTYTCMNVLCLVSCVHVIHVCM